MISREHQKNDSMQDYLKSKNNSSSDLKAILKTTKDYLLTKNPDIELFETTKAMIQGTVLHSMILEPDIESKDYVVFNEENRPEQDKTMRSNINKEWKAEMQKEADKEGKVLISTDDLLENQKIVKEFKKNKKAMQLLEGTVSEQSFYFSQPFLDIEFKAKIRPDAIDEEIGKGRPKMVSLKTTTDASPDSFYRTAGNLMYHLSDAYYLKWLEFITGEEFQLYQIVLQTKPPYHVVIYDCTPYDRHPKPFETFEYLMYGNHLTEIAMQRIVDWEINNKMFGFEDYQNEREDGMIDMDIPSWTKRDISNTFE